MTIRIRPAASADAPGIEAVHLAAFPTSAEADLVKALERAGEVALSLVADREGEIVGHLLFSRMQASAAGKPVSAVALAPVAVQPTRQRTGIGSTLIDQGLAELAERGTEWVFVLGEPDFYEQFGFDAGLGVRFASPYAGDYWMALALGGQRAPRSGEAHHAPAFAALGGQE